MPIAATPYAFQSPSRRFFYLGTPNPPIDPTCGSVSVAFEAILLFRDYDTAWALAECAVSVAFEAILLFRAEHRFRHLGAVLFQSPSRRFFYLGDLLQRA